MPVEPRPRAVGGAALAVRPLAGLWPAAAQLRQAEVGGEFPAPVPDLLSGSGGIAAVQAHRVPGHLARVVRTVPQPDQHAVLVQGGEEFRLGPGPARGGGYPALQRHPGRLGPAGPVRFLFLGPGRPLRGGPVGPGHLLQVVLGLHIAQGFADAVIVVV